MASDPRRQRGIRGELLAAEHLQRRGFSILQRNYRTRFGELDIVACDGRTLVFCEVKTRAGDHGGAHPLDSVGPRKRIQVRRMAGQWLSEQRRFLGARDLRFDAIGITLDAAGALIALDHVEGAF